MSGGQFGAPYFEFSDGAGQTPDFTTGPLYRGATYQFSDFGVSGSHPFMIGESYGDTTSSLVSGGPLNGSGGTITVSIPSDFNGSLYYFCTNHGAMVQEFMIDEPNHTVDLNSTVSLEMIWVDPGTFTMGSPVTEAGREPDESEQDVSITRGFFLGKYPVSQSQYEAIMNGVTGDANSTPSLFLGFPNRPVERVSYNDAQMFIHRLNQKESENIADGWGYALPTEAEWEYACRAGTNTPFSFGNSITTSDANYNANGFLETTDVGQYAANQWGFYDMAGNVWEWCSDWYGDYPGGSLTDPYGASTGTNRVARGGSFVNNGDNQRSASRNYWIPDGRHKAHGFRLAYKIIPNSAPTGLSIASNSGGGQARLLKNIAYEGNSSDPAEFTEFNGEVYFNASDANGQELWKTDGTESGTVMLKDIHPGTDSWGDPASSYPYNFIVFDGALYFAADDGNGTELWKSDGTESGTEMVKDILLDDGFGGIGSSNPSGFTEFNGSLYFSANDGNGTELWKTDGTASGTVIVKDIYPGSDNFGDPASSNPGGFTVFDGALYFRATDGNGTELWKSDGTSFGTEIVKDILLDNGFGSAGSSEPTGLTVFDGALYFSATDGNGTEVWKSDGTQSGTQLLKDVYPGEDGLGSVQSGNPTNFLEFDGSLYFTGTDGSGIELWKTDGTESGTSMVKDIFLGVNEWGEPSSSYPANLTVLNEYLFFDAMDENGTELWKTDGTESGTTMV
ncbi:MAG: SUMF1/EgtB/PvdO family nonheme iron enzyme, partial [Opitutales bacterium]|nr:SUMF1/EgtB/PvdO family nonheme iron enzyme [Opitutales bacterium]